MRYGFAEAPFPSDATLPSLVWKQTNLRPEAIAVTDEVSFSLPCWCRFV